MPELRHDPILPRWVLIAEDRGQRPDEFIVARAGRVARACPFCPGHENDTPHAILVIPEPETGATPSDWQIRVIPNRYPAVTFDQPDDLPPLGADLYRQAAAHGVHEVVIDCPQHVVSLSETSSNQAVALFAAFQQRLDALRRLDGIASALVFKNVGPAAGASIEHSHSQIVATARPTYEIAAEWTGSVHAAARLGGCPWCRMAAAAETGERLVAANASAIAFCPFAARFPYETWVVPSDHESHFERAGGDAIRDVARLVHEIICRLDAILDRPAYNFVIHTGPFAQPSADHYHWHVEIYPRITTLAGFELGGGSYINPVVPEEAAKALSEPPPSNV